MYLFDLLPDMVLVLCCVFPWEVVYCLVNLKCQKSYFLFHYLLHSIQMALLIRSICIQSCTSLIAASYSVGYTCSIISLLIIIRIVSIHSIMRMHSGGCTAQQEQSTNKTNCQPVCGGAIIISSSTSFSCKCFILLPRVHNIKQEPG